MFPSMFQYICIIFQLPILKMHHRTHNAWNGVSRPKISKPSTSQVKRQKPKPDWTTDFIDRSQYKLTEAEMIQKKAALQSKHREEARRQLEERRRKLEQGILDEQTRKVYETALISKNIDINPSVRKNLTEMIRYEKEMKEKTGQQMQGSEQQEYDSANEEESQQISEKQIKQAQKFIKKFQKAKKQGKIERAIEILTNEGKQAGRVKGVDSGSSPKVNNFLQYMEGDSQTNVSLKKRQKNGDFSQDEAISSIEDTIRFMQEKLFAAKKTVDQHSKSFINQNQNQNDSEEQKYKASTSNAFVKNKKPQLKTLQGHINHSSQPIQTKNKQQEAQKFYGEEDELQFGCRMADISQLRIQLREDNESDEDECMDTIRRMRELMDNADSHYELPIHHPQEPKMKQNIQDNQNEIYMGLDSKQLSSKEMLQCNSTIQKKNYNNYTDSDAQVSFSLTANNDDSYQQQDQIILSYSKGAMGQKPRNKNLISQQQDFMIGIRQNQNNEKRSNKNNQQDNQQYLKIKQNLFNCLGMDKDDDDNEDSLRVEEKINMWKQDLNTQSELRRYGQQIYSQSMTGGRGFLKQCEDEDEKEEYCLSQGNFSHGGFGSTALSINKPNKPPSKANTSKSSRQFEQMKAMISTASQEVKKIQIEPIKINSCVGNKNGDILGFDFRGSINIKKNMVGK